MNAEERLRRISLVMSYGGLIGLSNLEADATVRRLCQPYFDGSFWRRTKGESREELRRIVVEAEKEAEG
jgi:hypothetical protein